MELPSQRRWLSAWYWSVQTLVEADREDEYLRLASGDAFSNSGAITLSSSMRSVVSFGNEYASAVWEGVVLLGRTDTMHRAKRVT